MKHVWTLVLALLITSCTPPKTQEQQEQKESLMAPQTAVVQDAPGIAPITLDEAAAYISAFINHPAYGNIARNVALGGAFTKGAFEVPAGQGGVLFWYCQNKSDKAYPEFFLALDHIASYDTTNLPVTPAAEVMAPDYTFTYTEPKADTAAVKQYLKKLQVANQPGNKPLAKDKADAMINEFKTLIGTIGDCETDNCQYPFGYFDGNAGNYMDTFLAKNPTMVRYFYGYDKNYGANRIRIILIGTNDKGLNIMSLTGNDGSILQKSVPPPPIGFQ